MNVVAKVVLTAVVLAAGARATATVVHATFDFPRRTAVYFTEPQMVHLAHRVQEGKSLYPDWRTFPHVVNVFTPGYFWIVGSLGRAANASLEGLQKIARGVTLFFTLLGAVLVAAAVRPHGKFAMFAAGCLAVGSGVTNGFGWMARPDIASDVLGFAGFLAATSATPVGIGIALLAAGVLCKQTTVLYIAAATLALLWQGRWKRAVAAFVGSVALTGMVLSLVYFAGERRVFTDILLEASSPWKWDHWKTIAMRLLRRSGDVVLLCLLGGVGWIAALRSGTLESIASAKRWLALLLVASIFGGVGSAKFGSDLNYYLPLRFIAAAALAGILGRLASPQVGAAAIFAALLGVAPIMNGMLPMLASLSRHEAFNPVKRAKVELYEKELAGIAVLSRSKQVLTNNDDVALRIENPFMDPFLFKMLVDTGRLHPTVLEERLRRGEYDLIVATGEFDDPNYRGSAFAMPKRLAAAIEERYKLVSKTTLNYYRPKSSAGGAP
jgi:hypothetical protein